MVNFVLYKICAICSVLCCLCSECTVFCIAWRPASRRHFSHSLVDILHFPLTLVLRRLITESFTDEPNRILSKLAESMQGSWVGTRVGTVMWASLACQGAEVAWCPSRCPALAGTKEIAKTCYARVLSLVSDGMSHARTAQRGRN